MPPPQRGDEAELFESFNDELLRSVRRRVNRVSEANIEDACAVAWTQFLRYQPDRDRNWRGWLVRVAEREAIHLHRRELGVRHLGFVEEGNHDRVPEPADPRPSPQMERLEVRDALSVLGRVPERRREAAVLHIIGLRYVDIAKVLGVSTGRVDKLLAEASAHVRGQMVARQASASEHPRVARLQQLEAAPPKWLVDLIGRPPGTSRSTVLLAWRRAALAVEDYRCELGRNELADGLGKRPSDGLTARRYDRARDAVVRLQQARELQNGRSLER